MIKNIQLGKRGITDGFIKTLNNHFIKARDIRVSVLKSYCRDRGQLKEIMNELLEKLGKNFTSRAIGYTIVLKKWRKDVR